MADGGAKKIPTEREKARAFALADRPTDRLLLHLIWDAGLTVAEAAGLKWEACHGEALRLEAGRTVPLEPEVKKALDVERRARRREIGRPPRPGEYVFPAAGDSGAGAPVSRMTVSRRIRTLLDRAELRDIHPKELKELYILRQLECRPIEEAARISGVETRTLRDIWMEYGQTGALRSVQRTGGVDSAALEAALDEEDDQLDARVVRLSWQGGLTVREMRTLRWSEITEDLSRWSPDGRPRPIPPPIQPWLARWRERDRARKGGGWLVEGVRSGGPGDLVFLTRRANEFLIRHGLEEGSLVQLRGGGDGGCRPEGPAAGAGPKPGPVPPVCGGAAAGAHPHRG